MDQNACSNRVFEGKKTAASDCHCAYPPKHFAVTHMGCQIHYVNARSVIVTHGI